MSENTIEYHFINTKKPKTIKSVINKVCKIHKIDNQEEYNVCSGKNRENYYISMWFDDIEDAPLEETLTLLNTFPGALCSYAKV